MHLKRIEAVLQFLKRKKSARAKEGQTAIECRKIGQINDDLPEINRVFALAGAPLEQIAFETVQFQKCHSGKKHVVRLNGNFKIVHF